MGESECCVAWCCHAKLVGVHVTRRKSQRLSDLADDMISNFQGCRPALHSLHLPSIAPCPSQLTSPQLHHGPRPSYDAASVCIHAICPTGQISPHRRAPAMATDAAARRKQDLCLRPRCPQCDQDKRFALVRKAYALPPTTAAMEQWIVANCH